MDKFDHYKAAALTGILAGITFEPKEDGQMSDEDLTYLDLMCVRIANRMISEKY